MDTKICRVDGCEKAKNGPDWCSMHRSRFKTEGLFGGPICLEEGCPKYAMGLGRCGTHYARLRRTGEAGNPPCDFAGCEGYAMTRGLCVSHISQLDRGIELRPVRKSGTWGPWMPNAKGYLHRRRTLDGKREYELQHRVLMEEWIGRPLLRHEEVHHLNGNRADNRKENLELWSTRQPKGQRPEDKVDYALEILRLYAPEHLVE